MSLQGQLSVSSSASSSEDLEWDAAVGNGRRFETLDDVSQAIDACKKAILQTDENTDNRKDKVLQLIKLQICQADLKDRQDTDTLSDASFESRGHKFVTYQQAAGGPIPSGESPNRMYCQQCAYGIWVHLQGSHHCQDCGFSVHSSCIHNIMRGCVAQKVKMQPDFIMDICPEKTLPSLKYRCVECDARLTAVQDKTALATHPRLCDYTGLYFCGSCHWGATFPTPARIVHNWDFSPQQVSQATKQYLHLMLRKPVINVRAENPKLFAVVQELAQVDHLRHNVMLMKKYLVVCRIAAEAKILLHLVARQHFVDGPDLYSLQDLLDVKSGVLLKFLERVVKEFTAHIYNCTLCLAKGFICEICDSSGAGPSNKSVKNCGVDEVTFPFSDDAKTCPDCEGVFHRFCYKQVPECPKCKRLYEREQTTSK